MEILCWCIVSVGILIWYFWQVLQLAIKSSMSLFIPTQYITVRALNLLYLVSSTPWCAAWSSSSMPFCRDAGIMILLLLSKIPSSIPISSLKLQKGRRQLGQLDRWDRSWWYSGSLQSVLPFLGFISLPSHILQLSVAFSQVWRCLWYVRAPIVPLRSLSD